MNTKNFLIGLGVIVVGVLLYGAYQYPQQSISAGSPAGTTFNTAKIASEAIVVSTSTSFAILNSDASSRIITDGYIAFTGGTATITAQTITCATSTVATGITPANTNYVLNQLVATTTSIVPTSASLGYNASTSPGLTASSYVRYWASGTYLVCQTASTGAVPLFDPNVTGVLGFKYLAN